MVRLGGTGLVVTSLAALLAAPSSWGAAELGGGRLQVKGTASITFDSNIYQDAQELSDTVLRLRPSVAYIKDSGLLRLDSELYFQAIRYQEYDEENAEDYGLDLRLSFPQQEDAQIEMRGEARLMHYTAPNPEVGDIIESDRAMLRGSVLTKTSEKLQGRVEVSYDARDYSLSTYQDTTLALLDGSLLYAVSPRLRTFAGAGYTEFDVESSDESEDASGSSVRLFGGFQGNLTPKVTGTARLGYTTRRFDDADDFADQGAVVMSADLAWQLSKKTSFALQGSRFFDVTPTSVSYLVTNLTLRGRHQLLEKLSLDAFVSYVHGSFTASREESDVNANRTDDDYRLGGALAYQMNRYISARVDLLLSTRESTSELFENDRAALTFSLSGRF
jgi:hypothetical protein